MVAGMVSRHGDLHAVSMVGQIPGMVLSQVACIWIAFCRFVPEHLVITKKTDGLFLQGLWCGKAVSQAC